MYEASEVLAIGSAHELILGVKPFSLNNMDSEGQTDYADRIDDIDETDE